jgi:hypothetical protein
MALEIKVLAWDRHKKVAGLNCLMGMVVCVYLYITLIFLPPIITPFICSNDSCAASGMSYSMKANPLCLFVKGSHDKLTDFIGPNGKNACLMVSSLISKLILPTYILIVNV